MVLYFYGSIWIPASRMTWVYSCYAAYMSVYYRIPTCSMGLVLFERSKVTLRYICLGSSDLHIHLHVSFVSQMVVSCVSKF